MPRDNVSAVSKTLLQKRYKLLHELCLFQKCKVCLHCTGLAGITIPQNPRNDETDEKMYFFGVTKGMITAWNAW